MSTEPQVAVASGFLDKIGDGFGAVAEGFGRFLTRLFGSSNERFIKGLGYVRPNKAGAMHSVTEGSLLHKINALEEKMKALTPEEMQGLTPKFRERLAKGEKLDSLLPEAFAACREAGRRTKNMRHFDVQMLGGVVLHQGKIAEMVTGEGKTLVATLPAFLNALTGKGVHVITVNDYLARRDCEWMLPIYRALGVSAGFIQSGMDTEERRRAYDCDITYGTNSEFGFDYLRDNMKTARWGDNTYPTWQQQVQRALNFAIIDEVDNILIDEARTPLIISGQAFTDVRRYDKANQVAIQLADLQKSNPGKYYEVKEKEHTCHLTDEGIRKAEELAGVESFYTAGNMEWPHLIDNALKAHHLYKRDKRYAVTKDEDGDLAIVIIDEFTGRLMHGRQWSDGLHQAVEAKHSKDGVKIKEETQTLATVTLQNFFKMYKKLSGMTGTAMTEMDEFWKIYKLEVISVPTNKPLLRGDTADMIFRTEQEKWKAVVDEVEEVHKTGRPILIGTTDVDKSVVLSEKLRKRGIKHELLNALPEHASKEADIVAQAGRIGSVTIATNMAGRGTDIILGGNPETMAWSLLRHKYASRLDVPEAEWKEIVDGIEAKEKTKEEGRKVAAMGGLHIVGTERHEARRIDNQLRGRAGRQGDPGSSRFYLSLQDDLMRIFAGEWVSAVLSRLGMEEGQAIESRMVDKHITAAQKKVEERNFDSRKSLLEYDEVMDIQRKDVYGRRQHILNGANCKLMILEYFEKQVASAVDRYLKGGYGTASFADFARKRLNVPFEADEFGRASFAEAEHLAKLKADKAVEPTVMEAIEENLGSEEKREWNWQALAEPMASRYGMKVNDRDLRKVGKEGLADFLMDPARKWVETLDLSEGKVFLEADYALRSLSDWAKQKFGITVSVEELTGKPAADAKALITARVKEHYAKKEIDFPVQAGMAQFMTDRGAQGGHRYDRDGLFAWANERFPQARESLKREDFQTQSKPRLLEILSAASKASHPVKTEADIDAKLAEVFEGANRPCDEEDAKELSEWLTKEVGVTLTAESLAGKPAEDVRQAAWSAYGRFYRPEMAQIERNLVLHQLDVAWKNHLYTMDHLRSGIGLAGYASEDPKIKYKQEGMKEFRTMWDGVEDKIVEMVFRMEESEAFADTVWTIGAAVHEAAPKLQPTAEQKDVTNLGGEVKVTDTIRNTTPKVGRNDPCPCGSGKKYKNCHMKQTA